MSLQRIKLGGGRVRTSWVVATVLVAAAAIAIKVLVFDGTGYWVVTTDLPAGSQLTEENLAKVQLQLGTVGSNYLAGNRPTGYVAVGVAAGQLLAKGAVTSAQPGALVRVVVTSKTDLAGSVRGGAVVDIWAARKVENQFEPPALLVEEAGVVEIVKAKGVFSGTKQQVEVQVPAVDAPVLLDAVATDSAIFLVPRQ